MRAIVTEPFRTRRQRRTSARWTTRSSTNCTSAAYPSSFEWRSTSRHVRGSDRKNPLSAGTRRDACRTDAGDGFRRAGRSPPPWLRGACSNYWGYSTHSFYSPHPRYCVEPARAPQEFRALVDALHAAGIGVLLDVVFNHTAEAGANGPVINFKVLRERHLLSPRYRHDGRGFTATTRVAEIRSTAIIRWCPRSSCAALNTGCANSASMAFGSILRASSRAASTAN